MKDYEKKYKEALERAKKYKLKEDLIITQDIFPELAESDDEKIRKALIKIVNGIYQDEVDYAFVEDGISYEQLFNWLEKQGENFYNKELSELLHKVICRFINDPDIPYSERDEVSKKIIPYIEQLEKQGEQQDVSMQINPSEYINDMGGNGCYLKNTAQASAWSEEDEENIDTISKALVRYISYDGITQGEERRLNRWLKSIKERYTWKPSDEQMKALEKECIAHSNYELCRLLEQLKKLKG